MLKRLGLFLTVGLIAMLALAACGGGDDGGDGGDGGGNGDGGGDATSVEMGEFYFDPETLSGSAGEEVTLEFENAGEQDHDFVIEEWDVNVDLVAPGETASTTFTIPEDASGEVSYFCSVPGHRESGMEGTFTVE